MTEKIARRGLHIYREYSVDPQERIFVEEVMTHAVVSIAASATLHEIDRDYFHAQQRHRAFPVCAADGHLLGVLDRHDLSAYRAQYAGDTVIADLLTQSPMAWALPTETCQTVARRMAVLHVERLAVVEHAENLRLVGLISRSDLIKPTHAAFHEEHVRERLAHS